MKTLFKLAGLVIVIALVLAASCPDEASFGRYLDAREAPDEANAVERATDGLLRTQERLTADYSDYVLWAVVESTRGAHHEQYLGVFGIWINITGDGDG